MENIITSRAKFINHALYEFRGGLAREFYFNNEDYSVIPYYYNDSDDSLHSDDVSVPFHYSEEEINKITIWNSLVDLEKKLREYFKNEKGVTLYDFD